MSEKKKKKEEDNQPPVEENLPYTVGSWKGIEQYKCKACPFDTLNFTDMQVHVSKRHAPIPSQLVDRFGNQLT